ncbi:conserved exported hypothetical protein [Burkholderiales bacterium 8X]|nr:conserved exported hypothetical protein [Burkholderiales bacterium 8X]
MIKTQRMAAAAAALAMCMAGSAFAQDRRFDNHGPDRREHREMRDHRFDHRDDARRGGPDFRDGRFADRRGAYPNPHAEWRRGGYVPREYRARNYVVTDYRSHRLQAPPRGYQWVGVGGDYVLAAIATGLIAQIIANQ